MFSTENSSDPSCSLHKSKASSDLVFCLQHHRQLPKFSIRDYVSKSRGEDIRINWPLSQTLLKLCLDNGIRSLLPPFETTSLVKAHLLKRGAESEQLSICYENKVDQERIPDNELTRSDSEINLLPVSDPMASNVCPVCKSFTSSSNTTLNAHIDQCLSSDQLNVVKDFAELPKPRVKLGKKRLMADIYTTARRCTLEDLDRRNGTNWAANYLSLVEPGKSNDLETKGTKFAANASEGNVGDIYVDSNGTKLLILSKVNDSSPLVSRKNFRQKKHGKEFKEGWSRLSAKEKSSKPSNIPHNRSINTVKGFNMIEEGDEMTEARQVIEESQSQILNVHDHVRNSERPTLGHWVCSKRSELSRRHGNKEISKGSEKTISNSRKLLLKHTQPSLFHSSAKQNKRMDPLPENAKKKDGVKKSSLRPSSLNSKFILRVDSFHDVRHPSFKIRKCPTSLSRSASFSLETRGVDKRENLMSPTKLRKRQLISRCNKLQGGEMHNNGSQATGVFKTMETSNMDQSSLSENLEKVSLLMEDSTKSFVTVAPIIDTNLDPIQEEDADSISGNEIQIDSLPHRSTCSQEENSGDVISSEVSNQDIQISGDQAQLALDCRGFQTDTPSSHEPNPCFPYNREVGLENTQDNSLATSVTVESNQDDYMIVDTEPSGSPVSTISGISLPFTMDEKFKDSEERLSSMAVIKDDNVREPSCSCSKSTRESQFSKQSPKDTGSYSFINAPTLSPQILVSHSNPILRLMGKDLVVSKQESLPFPPNLPFDSDYSSDAKFISFISYNSQSHHTWDKLSSPSQCSMNLRQQLKPTVPLYQSRDVITINDESNEFGRNFTTSSQTVQNSNLMAPQMPFACFSLQNPHTSRGVFHSSQNSEGLSVFSSPSSLYFSQTL